MPVTVTRSFEASELIHYGKRKFDPKAYAELRKQLSRMELPETVDNRAMAAHIMINREIDSIEATFSRLREMKTLMEGMQINSGSMILEMKLPREDFVRFNIMLYDLIDDAKFILNRWHRFVQASALSNVPSEGDKG